MLKLFNDSETFQTERPTKPTETQLKDLYERMAKEMISEGFTENDEEEIVEDLKDLYPFYDNGFELGKKLNGKYGYQITVPFCEWLECLESELRDLVTQNVKDWVSAHNPQPNFEKGTKLILTSRLCHGFEKGDTAFINGGRPEEAVYWVNKDADKYGGTVLPYEKVEKCCEIVK